MTFDEVAKILVDNASSTPFKYFIVPLVTAAISVFVKKASKNDRFAIPCKEDYAVGLELSLASTLGFMTYSVSIAHRLMVANHNSQVVPDAVTLHMKLVFTPLLALALLVGLWAVSHIIRKFGWQDSQNMTWFCGIILPFIYGLFNLIAVVYWIGN